MRARRFDTRSVVVSWAVAATLFLAVDMIGRAATVSTLSAWATPRRISWLLLGGDIAESASTTQPGLLVLALVLHGMLALAYTVLIVAGTRHFEPGLAVLIGALLGLGLYIVNYYVLTPLFPVFADVRGPIAITAHLVFGATAAGTHVLMHPRPHLIGAAHAGGPAAPQQLP